MSNSLQDTLDTLRKLLSPTRRTAYPRCDSDQFQNAESKLRIVRDESRIDLCYFHCYSCNYKNSETQIHL